MDDRRAMQIFLRWCFERSVPPYLENITRRIAVRFKNEIMSYTGLGWATCTKYLGRIKKYWDFLLEGDLIRSNVWPKKGLAREHEFIEDKERAFSDNEVVVLLTGTNDVKMLDVMLVAALTGARVDAVIDLKVGDCSHGCFRFKGQKRELGRRYVPIHPALDELVTRRTNGRGPDQELFPEWPGPVAAGSVRERSSYFSKRFTAYRRSLGVTDERDEKRRSLLNFHSFRRWFITKGERAGISGDLLAAIVGHKRSGLTLGHYSEGPEIMQARRAIRKIQLPPLDGRKVVEAQALLPRTLSASRVPAA
jgi:integrase